MDRDLTRRFWRLSIPNVLSNLLVPLAGLVDMALLGHLDEIRHLAGVSLGVVIFDYVYWSFGFLRMGTTGLVAQANGAGEERELRRIFLRGLLLALIGGGLLLALRTPLLRLSLAILQGESSVELSAAAYYRARIWAAPVTLANFVILGLLLGRERARQALWISAVGHGGNILLDLWFIFGLGWAAAGAGAATALSQLAMLITGAFILRGDPLLRGWRLELASMRDLRALTPMLKLNANILVRTVALVSVFAAFTNLASAMGVAVLAATALLRQVVTLAAWFIDGFAFATEALAGHLHGARRASALKRLLRFSCALSALTGLLFALAFVVAPRSLLALLTDHAEIVDLAMSWTWWLLPVMTLGGVAYALDGYFLGLARGRELRAAMLESALIGFVPLAWWALHAKSPHLLWLALSSFMAARVLSLGIRSRAWNAVP